MVCGWAAMIRQAPTNGRPLNPRMMLINSGTVPPGSPPQFECITPMKMASGHTPIRNIHSRIELTPGPSRLFRQSQPSGRCHPSWKSADLDCFEFFGPDRLQICCTGHWLQAKNGNSHLAVCSEKVLLPKSLRY